MLLYGTEVPVLDSHLYLHDRSQNHAHYLFHALSIETNDHTPFILAVFITE